MPVVSVLGRFNYVSFRKDNYTVVFVPRYGNSIIKIASNLDRDCCMALMNELNGQLDYLREAIPDEEGDDE
jgi:hypothetical protein